MVLNKKFYQLNSQLLSSNQSRPYNKEMKRFRIKFNRRPVLQCVARYSDWHGKSALFSGALSCHGGGPTQENLRERSNKIPHFGGAVS